MESRVASVVICGKIVFKIGTYYSLTRYIVISYGYVIVTQLEVMKNTIRNGNGRL